MAILILVFSVRLSFKFEFLFTDFSAMTFGDLEM